MAAAIHRTASAGQQVALVTTGSKSLGKYNSDVARGINLSSRYAVAYDLQVGPVDGTNSGARILYGNVRCQSPFVGVPPGTTREVSIDLSSMTCNGGTPDKTRATAIYLRFSAGVFHFDNVRVK